MNDDFYIGYLDRSPPALARHTRRLVVALVMLVAGLTAILAARQAPAEAGTFEFGVQRGFEGVLQELPLPLLRTVSATGSLTNYLLVGAGKHGLPAFARGHNGERVRFRGSLIRKGAAMMVELNDAPSFISLGPASAQERGPAPEPVGDIALTGELVDTKCYFGVMRPATGKVHRACAVRCLSGGVPPGLLVRDGQGNGMVVLLAGPDGRPLGLDPQWAARSLRVEGKLTLLGNIASLAVTKLALAKEAP